MAENTKTSQLPTLQNDSLGALFRMAFAGADYSMSITQLNTILNTETTPTPIQIAPSTTEDVNLGASATYDKMTVDYVSVRGTRVRCGIIQIINDGTDSALFENGYGTLPSTEVEDGGISFTTSLSAGQVVLTIDTDGSDASDTFFKYKLTTQ
jgi:hypothetical protein